MTKLLVILGLIIFSTHVWCKPSYQKIRTQIVTNNPKLQSKYVHTLTKTIVLNCIKYKIPCSKFTAILMQESRYKLEAFNQTSKDHGIAQINEKTAKAFGFNLKRLRTDLAYSVEAGAQVLADFKRMYGHKEDDFWTRYNSSKPSKRQQYMIAVARFE